jgi:hypothetical protein
MSWKEYIKKPIVIHAKQMKNDFEIETPEGVMRGRAGDYVVCGIEGETYPVKKDIFKKTYEKPGDEKRRCKFSVYTYLVGVTMEKERVCGLPTRVVPCKGTIEERRRCPEWMRI